MTIQERRLQRALLLVVQMSDTAKCTCCGKIEYINLLDGKSPTGDENGDFTALECIACYGPGWCPTGGVEDILKSVRPDLLAQYAKWKARQ